MAGLGELALLHVDSESVTGEGLQALSSGAVQYVYVCGDSVEIGHIPHLSSLKMLTLTDKAAAALPALTSSVDTERHGEPAMLGVITSTGYAGRRPDGVHVIPITALGP